MRSPPLFRPITLALAVAALEIVAVPAEAQRRPTRSTSRETTRQSPLQYAVSLKRAGRSAGQAAVALTRQHRLKSDAVASTLLRAGYEPSPVGRALVDQLRVTPERATGILERAGVRDEDALFETMVAMYDSRVAALRALKRIKGPPAALLTFRRSAVAPISPNAVAAELHDAGYSLDEIAAVLMEDHGMSELDVYELFLAEDWVSTQDAVRWALMESDIVSISACEVFEVARKVDESEDLADFIIEFTVGNAADLIGCAERTRKFIFMGAVAGGGDLVDVVQWATEAGGATAEQVAQWLMEAGADAGDIAGALHEAGATPEEIAEALHEAGLDAEEIAAALVVNGIDALAVALALDGIGEDVADVVRVLQDEVGAGAEEIAEILTEMGLSAAETLQLLTTVMGLTHDTAMAIIRNL